MTETRTDRLNLPQWSTGEDEAGSWEDFTGAFADLEDRAAIDRGTSGTALPTGQSTAEYTQRTASVGGDTLRALYRTDSGATWRALSWIPERLRVRPAETVVSTAEGFRVDHPDLTAPALATTWDGKATVRDSLILGGSADTVLGRLAVGGLDALPAATRVRFTGYGVERVLELRAGNASVTELLRFVDSAGSTVTVVSGTGELTSTQRAAFGGTAVGAGSITAAPQPTGVQTAGILAHGLEAAPTRAALQVNRHSAGDTASILTALPDAITVGRTGTWTGATVTIGAPSIIARADRLAWFPTVADITSGAKSAGMDATTGLFSTIGTALSNAGAPTASANNLFSFPSAASSWTGQLFRAFQAEIVGTATETTEVVRLDGVGRLLLNAPWRGSGNRPAELRDARQSVLHFSTKVWAAPGTYEAGPQVMGGGSSFTYTWPVMTVRSSSATQLDTQCRLEAQYFRNTGGDTPIERQTMQLQWDISINGGAWTFITQNGGAVVSTQEQGSLVSGSWSDSALTQDTFSLAVLSTIAAGSTFQLRFRVQVATGSDAADAITPAYVRLRRADLYVRESIIQAYTAA